MTDGISRTARIAILASLAVSGVARAAPSIPDLGNPVQPAPYEDHLIDNGALAPMPSEEQETHYDTEGWARNWRMEGFASRIDQGGSVTHENGMVLNGTLDTPDYGALTFDGNFRGQSSRGVFTVWQRGLPFDNGWRANDGVGMLNTPSIDLSRQQFRFFMPTFPIVGAETEWLRRGDVQIQASVGEPGTYDGLRLPGFSRIHGSLFTGGAQWNVGPHWQAGFQAVDAIGVEAGLDTNDPLARTDAHTLYGALAWTDRDTHLQFNLLDSELDVQRHNLGLWLDGESSMGRYRHNYGVFRFDPNLSWGYSPVNRDLMGAYYRVSYASQQWSWSGGFDSTDSLTSLGSRSLYGTGNLRYQADHTLGVGGGATWRRSGGDAASVYGFVDKLSRYGTTRVQVDVVSAQGAQQGEQVTVDHAWPTSVGLRLSTTLTIGVEKSAPDAPRTRRASLAASGGIDLTGSLSIDGSVRWSEDRDTARTIGRYANVGLVWRISPKWSLIASYYDNRSTTTDLTFTGIAPVTSPISTIEEPRDRAIFLTVRYEDHAGTPVAPLGGLPGAGAGTLTGTVFYDDNEDGVRGASETGAANVTVLLDGRFAARTDSQGRFTFPMVAAGPHVVIVVPDNLALSYNVSNDGRRAVVVPTRDIVNLDIGATHRR